MLFKVGLSRDIGHDRDDLIKATVHECQPRVATVYQVADLLEVAVPLRIAFKRRFARPRCEERVANRYLEA